MKGTVRSIAVLVALALGASDADAQLFGQRNLGNPLARRSNGTTQGQDRSQRGVRPVLGLTRLADAVLGNAAAQDGSAGVRINRRPGGFVGKDSAELDRFVGAQQASDGEQAREVTTAVEDLEIETAPDANQAPQPVLPPRATMYPPRLAVGFSFPVRAPTETTARLTNRLASALSLPASSSIEVTVEGGAATLRGEVQSERQRRLAALLVRFEPGIAEVRNELRVAPVRSATPKPAAPSRP